MKTQLQIVLGLGLAPLFLGLTSCRSSDTEQSLQNGGTASVRVNLTGNDYAASGSSSQASLKGAGVMGGEVQRHSVSLSPSSVLVAELIPSGSLSGAQASAKLSSLAAVPGSPLVANTKFRVIAYEKSSGNYKTHQDYTVGSSGAPLVLDNGVAYTLVTYAYNATGTSGLYSINPSEQGNISTAKTDYDYKFDFLYSKQDFTPTSSESTLNVTLRHKLNEITTVVESKGYGNITSITNASISPQYNGGKLNLATGVMGDRTTQTTKAVSFTQTSPTVQTATPVLVNASEKGSFTATMNVGGVPKTISLPNYFTITPERKSTLKINLIKCGAYIGPNTDPANYKEFMCQNMGATAGLDPFSLVAGNHGAKYQWGAKTNETGRYYSQANDQSNSGDITGWINSLNPKPDGSWSDTSKTTNDPCPSGYRVPTRAQWRAVLDNNTFEYTTSAWTNSPTNYSSALYITHPITHVRTLMLPAAGYRGDYSGNLNSRGYNASYWSSSDAPLSNNEYFLYFTSSSVSISYENRASGNSVRCISE